MSPVPTPPHVDRQDQNEPVSLSPTIILTGAATATATPEEARSLVHFICCFCFTEKSRTGTVTATSGASMTGAGEYANVAD